MKRSIADEPNLTSTSTSNLNQRVGVAMAILLLLILLLLILLLLILLLLILLLLILKRNWLAALNGIKDSISIKNNNLRFRRNILRNRKNSWSRDMPTSVWQIPSVVWYTRSVFLALRLVSILTIWSKSLLPCLELLSRYNELHYEIHESLAKAQHEYAGYDSDKDMTDVIYRSSWSLLHDSK